MLTGSEQQMLQIESDEDIFKNAARLWIDFKSDGQKLI